MNLRIQVIRPRSDSVGQHQDANPLQALSPGPVTPRQGNSELLTKEASPGWFQAEQKYTPWVPGGWTTRPPGPQSESCHKSFLVEATSLLQLNTRQQSFQCCFHHHWVPPAHHGCHHCHPPPPKHIPFEPLAPESKVESQLPRRVGNWDPMLHSRRQEAEMRQESPTQEECRDPDALVPDGQQRHRAPTADHLNHGNHG